MNFFSRFFILSVLCLALIHPTVAQETVAQPYLGAKGVERTISDIIAQQARTPRRRQPRIYPHLERELRKTAQNPNSKNLGTGRTLGFAPDHFAGPNAPQTLGISFTGSTLADDMDFPPDSMGAVGPSQFLVTVNGRIRSFNKTSGVADGVLDVDTDVFFSSVSTTPPSGDSTSTFDPRVRYDRLSGRWIIIMVDVTVVNSSGAVKPPNRVLLAVSDSGTLTSISSFTFFFFKQDFDGGEPGNFADYPTLGVDANACYIGVIEFSGTTGGTYAGSTGFVVRKSSILNGGPIVVSAFRNLTGSQLGAGPASPQGVDNLDGSVSDGYFIGSDNSGFGTLMIRRVSNSGGTPTISPNIPLTVASTSVPQNVPHLGNTGGTSGYLDGIDDRLMMAVIRNGHIWTAHAINVDATGVATTSSSVFRDAVRWYEIQDVSATPSLAQSGTIFDPTSTNPLNYWIPSIMISGQRHVAVGFSVAGPSAHADAGTTGRLADDAAGTMRAPITYTASNTAYNLPADTFHPRRWGRYSFTSIDPDDDMTMWTVQEFCDATNSWGVRVTKLIAPPPATPSSCSPPSVPNDGSNTTVVVTGTATNGSGFFDPGNGFAKHLLVTVDGGGVAVNSAQYIDPTHTSLNISVMSGATLGPRTVTVTNPDGQVMMSGSGILTVIPLKIISITHPASNTIHLQCLGVPSAVNRIESSPDLSANSFTTLTSISTDATGMFQYDDTNAGTKKFYRLAYP